MPGAVVRLEAAAGTVSALVAGSSTEDDAVHLWRSPVAKDDWQEVPALAVLPPADLAVQGAGNVAVIGARGSGFWISRPRGLTEYGNPCNEAPAVRLSWVGSLWATCATGTAATIHVSSDGRRWTAVAPPAASGAWSNQILVGARTDRDAIVLPSHEGRMSRLDAAGNLTDVAGPPAPSSAPSYLGFTTPAVGYAIVAGALHRTDDGGDTWKRMSLENP